MQKISYFFIRLFITQFNRLKIPKPLTKGFKKSPKKQKNPQFRSNNSREENSHKFLWKIHKSWNQWVVNIKFMFCIFWIVLQAPYCCYMKNPQFLTQLNVCSEFHSSNSDIETTFFSLFGEWKATKVLVVAAHVKWVQFTMKKRRNLVKWKRSDTKQMKLQL